MSSILLVSNQVLPKIIELWGLNVQTDVDAKKTSLDRPRNDNCVVFASVRAVRDFHRGAGPFDYWNGE